MYSNTHKSNYSDDIINIPYNYKNILINKSDIISIFKKVGLTSSPLDIKIYQNAFIHKSYIKRRKYKNDSIECPKNCLELFPNSNERLEFLGDSIIDSVVVSYLYRRYPDADEGFLTKLKTRLVRTDALASFSNYFDLGQFLIISKHVEEKCNGRENPRILEDLFECFIGAIYLDFSKYTNDSLDKLGLLYPIGYAVCESFLVKLLENRVDFESLVLNDENYKDILLRYFQQQYGEPPKYIEIKSDGPAHQRHFTMGVLDKAGNIIGKATEKSKKKAEQAASKEALRSLNAL